MTTDPCWAISEALADALGIISTAVLPMWGLDQLFETGGADYYIWPPAGARPAILAWLAAHNCAHRLHPDDARVIIAEGRAVAAAIEEARDAHC